MEFAKKDRPVIEKNVPQEKEQRASNCDITATMVVHAKNGDLETLGMLLDRYRPYLRILADRQIGQQLQRRIDASDLIQETFLEAQRDFEQFTGSTEPEFTAWLVRILQHNLAEAIRNHALVAKRAIGRERPLPAGGDSATLQWREPAADQSSPSQRAMRGEAAIELALALGRLPADQREAVRLRHLEGWTLKRIAELLERSEAAAASLIKRGIQNLQTSLKPPP